MYDRVQGSPIYLRTSVHRTDQNLHKWLVFKSGSDWVAATPKMPRWGSQCEYFPTWSEAIKKATSLDRGVS